MEAIKFIDLKPQGEILKKINEAYDRVLNSGTYIGGKEVKAFEEEWADYCGAKYCIGVGNGHDALSISCSFMAEEFAPIKPGMSTPWKTCLPTWSAARKSCSPIPENYITDYRTTLFMAVHIYGKIELPKEYESHRLIEDCAQAHGAKKNGIMAGKFGKVAAWSFYPTKNLGALGDAGAITTDDPEVAYYAFNMRDYGDREDLGINSRLDPLQAAILRAKLPYLDEWNKRRVENVMAYIFTINHGSVIDMPQYGLEDRPCFHIFAIESDRRDELKHWLWLNNIETMVHYVNVPYPRNWKVPEAERWISRTLSLPIGPHVTPEQCKRIAETINEWMDA